MFRNLFRRRPAPEPLSPMWQPEGVGWRLWTYDVPCTLQAVEAMRREWREPEVLRPIELPAAFNVADLWWRPLQRPRLEPEAREALGKETEG